MVVQAYARGHRIRGAAIALAASFLLANSSWAAPPKFDGQGPLLQKKVQVRKAQRRIERRKTRRQARRARNVVSVPELDPTGASAAFGLLACGVLLLGVRRRRD